ncbi:MAG: YdcH family protein [Hyphomicrobium sp.]|uniref:YdcH family protein n=1 Tax=Hyphomicrobium sp. TaxID=82 RepID=UPI003D1091DF
MDSAWQICNNDLVFNSEKEVRMALSAHLQELSERHRQLERRIEEEAQRPGSDDVAIRRLKQEKLKLKDEIFRLETETRH